MGYGLCVGTRIRITPQIGGGCLSVTGNQETKSYMLNATIDSRTDYAITSCLGLNLTPEMGFGISESSVFSKLAKASTNIKGLGSGFNLKIGIYLFF